jgi:hypothetical protein
MKIMLLSYIAVSNAGVMKRQHCRTVLMMIGRKVRRKVIVPAISPMELRKTKKRHVRIPGAPSGIRNEYLPNVNQTNNIALTVLVIAVVRVKKNIKLSMCFINQHHAMKTHGGVGV